jgi:hypothetical protein
VKPIKSKNLTCNPEKSLSQAPKTPNETLFIQEENKNHKEFDIKRTQVPSGPALSFQKVFERR